MDGLKLFEVRCPNIITDKNDKKRRCNKLCVKVRPGSSGEIQCRGCKTKFDFYVDSQAKSILSVKTRTKE